METISLPQKIEIKPQGGNKTRIIIEPCYPGYGTTLGNALRRVLLSSLAGAAVTSVKIEGIAHEFSTLPGVKEDVVSIILNLKKLRFKTQGEGPFTLTLDESGEKTVTAADFKKNPQVEIVNKDQVIATLTDKKAKLKMEIEVKKGLGYVPVEWREREKREIGVIAIDSLFSPIQKVGFDVENVRVGKRTDYDRVILDIETDGTLSGKEAFYQAVQILIDQFKALLPSKEEKEEKKEEKEEKKEEGKEEKKKKGRASKKTS